MPRLFFFALLALTSQIEAFTFSPHPNRVIHFPNHLKTYLNQTRSSYFGYSLVIRPTSILVGAPRAQSTLEKQNNIVESGAIFRCSVEDGTCFPYVLDSHGNLDAPPDLNNLKSQGKDYQWLGGSMDGGTQDTDKLLVCAPRFTTPRSNSNDSKEGYLHGICYWVMDTLANNPRASDVFTICPLRLKKMQMMKGDPYFYMGELGLSAHVPDDNSQFVIGAPGIDIWRGSVILYQRNKVRTNRRPMTDVAKNIYNPEFDSNILQPSSWGEKMYSYIGYAVSSGYFDSDNLSKLLYMATAPHANNNLGEAYIFDALSKNVSKLHVFQGEQLGDFFGYSVLAEDLNGDGLTDVIISAPLYAAGESYDVGALYVYINKGFFNFERKIVRSPVDSPGRFGTALSRLGDINHDGYNDVAVGAPFHGNGAVFIYLGSEDGLRDQPCQRLDAPSEKPSQWGSYMFGHGLSRGSDIDGNGINDMVIGAPNAEALYIYRTYPVVKIYVTAKSESEEIKPYQDSVNITACYRITTPSQANDVQQQRLNMRINIDKLLKRVKFAQTQTNELIFEANAGPSTMCRDFVVQVGYKGEILTDIDLEIHYELSRKVPYWEEFCETCAVVNPSDPTVSTGKISFITGCATNVCVTDLQLRSQHVRTTYTLGTTNTLRLNYEVTSIGETAYPPQFNVTSLPRLPFAQVPGNCRIREEAMVCDLNSGRPLAKGDTDSLTIIFDVSQLSGYSLIIEAAVFSAGIDRNPTDNRWRDVISLKVLAKDARGGSTDGRIVLDKYSAEIVNNYEIMLGSSTFKPLINPTSLQMGATYSSDLLPGKLYDQNNVPDKSISPNMGFKVDMIEDLSPFEYLVPILTDLKLLIENCSNITLMVINQNIKPNVIFKMLKEELPILYIILAVAVGLLILAAITYALFKLGFFKRLKRDELNILKANHGPLPNRDENHEDPTMIQEL
ncbi:integrin alpha-PS3-like [Drosophila eugracilis]|uniref:integrin alpha-PS3-like n=1 Tax=Drosophila eugracilis TaxID=29029 RepID=UPI001BD92A1B|nr:integrin alpha-PS3-like [Drosophila eugracilis]